MGSAKRSIEVDEATAVALEARAAEAGVSVPELLAQIVRLPDRADGISDEELEELDRRLADHLAHPEAVVDHDEVVAWLKTWGTPDFKPWRR
jgi:hypothetical protein